MLLDGDEATIGILAVVAAVVVGAVVGGEEGEGYRQCEQDPGRDHGCRAERAHVAAKARRTNPAQPGNHPLAALIF